LIIGTGSKDKFNTDHTETDSQFAGFFLDPLLAHLFNSVLRIPIPPRPRLDLLPLVQYMAPICPGCGPNDAGPIAVSTLEFRQPRLPSRSASGFWLVILPASLTAGARWMTW
jgi:hypothetical protein